MLTACQATVSSMPDEKSALAMLMKAQRETKNSSSLHSFCKKSIPGCDKRYGILCYSHETEEDIETLSVALGEALGN